MLCLCADRPRAMVDVALAPSTLISAARSALSETAKANICPRRKPQSPRRWASALPQRQPTKLARHLRRLALSKAKPNGAGSDSCGRCRYRTSQRRTLARKLEARRWASALPQRQPTKLARHLRRLALSKAKPNGAASDSCGRCRYRTSQRRTLARKLEARRWASALLQRQPTKARPLPSTKAARRAAPRIEAGRLALSIAKPNDVALALAQGRDAVEARVGRVSTRRLHGTALLIGALRRSKRALEPDGDNTPTGQYALHVKPGGQDPPYPGGRSSWLSVLANEWGSSCACTGGVRGVARRARSPAPFRLSPEARVRSTPRALGAANAPSHPQRRQQPWT